MTPGAALATGLCSVTFRRSSVAEVVALAAGAGLDGIEWGADVHVPPGDLAAATEAADRTRAAGLRVASYGSYLFADADSGAAVGPVLETAAALGTDLVRVWCPFGVEPEAAAGDRGRVVDRLGVLADAARGHGMTLYLEFHGGTLTASARSTVALLEEVDADNLATAWQPPYWDAVALARSPASAVADLALVAPWLAHLHVYEWSADGTRHPLAAGEPRWPAVLAAASAAVRPGLERFALLEFVAGDDPSSLAADAATLLGWRAALR